MIDAVPEIEPLAPLPPDAAVLAVRPGPDRVHTIMRITRDVTILSEDQQKLLVHMMTDALTRLEQSVKGMNRIETASRLAKIERVKQAITAKGNGESKS